ncbi:MAG: cohesin domain-containing protein [Euryarchaeota archaeon]|nr:cohesin domain-containing protein [Euryarchaeota archaeon]
MNISVDPDIALAGMQFDLRFDATLLRVNSVTEGDFLNRNGALTSFINGTIDNTAGTVTNVFGCILGHYNATASGTFAIISMTAKDSLGTSDLNLMDVLVSDPYGCVADIDVFDGTAIVDEAAAPVILYLANDTPTKHTVNLNWECSAPDVDYYTVYQTAHSWRRQTTITTT